MGELVWRFLSNNWYNINIKGGRYGYFRSGRGIKQGDPLSPSLFIIGTELLASLMEQLKNERFIPYFVDRGCPSITHLSYANDTILFSSGHPLSLIAMMGKLSLNERMSGQLVNKTKSCSLVAPNTSQTVIEDIKQVTGFTHSIFLFSYLGCPIYVRNKVVYFGDLVD